MPQQKHEHLMRVENLNKFLTMVHKWELIENDLQLVRSLQKHIFILSLGHKLKCVTMNLCWTFYFWEMPVRPNKPCFESWLRTSRLIFKQSKVPFLWQYDIGFVFYSMEIC